MAAWLMSIPAPAAILLCLALMLLSGFLVTRITKLLRLPNVSGYIIAGMLIGPHILNLIPQPLVSGMEFVSDIALSFIAFGVGKFFKLSTIRSGRKRVVVITLFESLAAGVIIAVSMHYIFNMTWDFSMLLGAIATATAPASTLMTIRQYHARGEFVDTLLQIVAFDDVVCLFIFSIISAVIRANFDGRFTVSDVLLPVLYNIIAVIIGFLCGFVLSKLLNERRSQDNRLILVIAFLLGLSGLCAIFNISPLLSCMIFGAAYVNLTEDARLYRQLDGFTPPIMSMFFIISGMNLNVSALAAFGIVGISYFFIRIIGKYVGSFCGCVLTKTSSKTRMFLGLALVPQAGVSIGLAFLGQRMLPPDIGSLLLTIILSSSVLYELIGPACAKAALVFSGSIPDPSTKPSGPGLSEIVDVSPSEDFNDHPS